MQTQSIAEAGSRRRHHISPDSDDDTLLNSAQARAKVGGVTDMTLWRWMRDDRVKFPIPIKLNRINYWRQGDVRRWLAERQAQKAVA